MPGFVYQKVPCVLCDALTTSLTRICRRCAPKSMPECIAEMSGEALEAHEARIAAHQERAESGLPLFCGPRRER